MAEQLDDIAPDLAPDDPSVLDAILTTKEATPKPGPDQEEQPIDDTPPDEAEGDEELEPSEKEEAEAEEDEEQKTSAEDVDIDELLVEITIDGKAQEIPLKDLKQNYSGNKYIEQNVQKAVEVRKAVEYNAAVLYEANQAAAQRLQSLNAVLDSMTQPQIDWDLLKARNPTEYVLKREELRDLQDKQRLVQQEVERINGEQVALQSQARQRVVLDQAQLLAAQVPELTDAKKAPQVMAQWTRTAQRYGFSAEEVGGVIDHRQMLILRDLNDLLNEKEQRSQLHKKANGDASASSVSAPKKVLLRPGSSQNSAAASEKRLTVEAYNRARKTGSIEDVAKTLILSAPKRR